MKDINLFGTEINFNHGGSNQYKTSFGFVLSALFLVITGILIYLLGRDFFLRRNPKTRFTENKSQYQFYELNNSTFDFMFRIEDQEGNLVQNSESVFKISARFSYYEKNSEGIYDGGYSDLDVKYCNYTDDLISTENFKNNFNLSNFLCFDKKNITIGGYWDYKVINYLNFQIDLCNKTVDQKCDKELNQEKFINENFYYAALYFQEAVIDTEKYEDSLYVSSKLIFTPLDTFFSKSINLFFKQASLLSDYGWIFPNKKDGKLLSFDYLTTDYNIYTYPRLFNFYIYSSKKMENTIREYPKIQSVIAEIGGLLNFLILVFGSASKIYSINHLKLKVISAIKQVKEDSIRKTTLKNNLVKSDKMKKIIGMNFVKNDNEFDSNKIDKNLKKSNLIEDKLTKFSFKSLEEIKNEQLPMKLQKNTLDTIKVIEDRSKEESIPSSNNLENIDINSKSVNCELIKANDIILEIKSDSNVNFNLNSNSNRNLFEDIKNVRFKVNIFVV